jgi:hypothetical protein
VTMKPWPSGAFRFKTLSLRLVFETDVPNFQISFQCL